LPGRRKIDESPDKPARSGQSALGFVYSIWMPIGGRLKQRFLVFFLRCIIVHPVPRSDRRETIA
jgi:hypothetical protein